MSKRISGLHVKNIALHKMHSGKKFNIRPTALFEIKPSVRKVYKLVQKSTGALGGNGYDGAIYGELTIGSMQKVLLL